MSVNICVYNKTVTQRKMRKGYIERKFGISLRYPLESVVWDAIPRFWTMSVVIREDLLNSFFKFSGKGYKQMQNDYKHFQSATFNVQNF